jgi:hypothetical protein
MSDLSLSAVAFHLSIRPEWDECDIPWSIAPVRNPKKTWACDYRLTIGIF